MVSIGEAEAKEGAGRHGGKRDLTVVWIVLAVVFIIGGSLTVGGLWPSTACESAVDNVITTSSLHQWDALSKAGLFAAKAACNGITGSRPIRGYPRGCRIGAPCPPDPVDRCGPLVDDWNRYHVPDKEHDIATRLCKIIVGRLTRAPPAIRHRP